MGKNKEKFRLSEDGTKLMRWGVDKDNTFNELFGIKEWVTVKGIKVFYAFENIDEDRTVMVVGLRLTDDILGNKIHVLKLGHAIKAAEDSFDFDYGFNLAVNRALDAYKSLLSNSYSMLAYDRCQVIVEDELSYIINNIEKYI